MTDRDPGWILWILCFFATAAAIGWLNGEGLL